jgi:hypothetical protein
MMRAIRNILILLIIFPLASIAQVNMDKIFRVDDGKMILTCDLKWNAAQRYSIANNFDLDSIAIEKAYKGATEVTSGNAIWKVNKINSSQIEIYKSLESKPINHIRVNDILIIDDSWLNISVGAPPIYAKSGINKLKRNEVFSYKNGIATFFLPSNKSAKNVYLSGSFNSWSTMQTPMQRVDSGWIVRMKLIPGKYTYKYIADGRWHTDPNNFIRENDTQGGYNSVIFCTNYQFHLKGYIDARRVVLAGSFNGWSTSDFIMIKTKDGWQLPIYLNEGTHAYKFIVEDQWITDPENKDIRKDSDGNLNSFIGFGDAYLFTLAGYQNASRVILSGSFNGWSTNELIMEKTKTGWQLSYILAPGTYEYKFIVDGQWMADPANPQFTGSGNYKNSVLTFKPNFTFTFSKFLSAKQVSVTGNFNGWNREGYKMYKKDGIWVLPLHLNKGKYLYKFVVDGAWYTDPDNKLWEENEYGTGNSVVWVE